MDRWITSCLSLLINWDLTNSRCLLAYTSDWNSCCSCYGVWVLYQSSPCKIAVWGEEKKNTTPHFVPAIIFPPPHSFLSFLHPAAVRHRRAAVHSRLYLIYMWLWTKIACCMNSCKFLCSRSFSAPPFRQWNENLKKKKRKKHPWMHWKVLLRCRISRIHVSVLLCWEPDSDTLCSVTQRHPVFHAQNPNSPLLAVAVISKNLDYYFFLPSPGVPVSRAAFAVFGNETASL